MPVLFDPPEFMSPSSLYEEEEEEEVDSIHATTMPFE